MSEPTPNAFEKIEGLKNGLFKVTMQSIYSIAPATLNSKIIQCIDAPNNQRNQRLIILLLDLILYLNSKPGFAGSDFDNEYESFTSDLSHFKSTIEVETENFKDYIEKQKREIEELRDEIKALKP